MQSKSVVALGQIEFSGNIIPPHWFKVLRLSNGKPNLPAIMILSELVYWFRPSRPRDEETGRPLPLKQKFKADKLQRTYADLADHFGFGKDQVRDACYFLQDRGLITIEQRTVDTSKGRLGNVTYFDVCPEEIRKITHPVEDAPSQFPEDTLSVSTPIGMGLETDTCTEISTETSERERATSSAENPGQPKLSLVSSVDEKPKNTETPFSPNDDFSQTAPTQQWTVAERFILKACNLWDELANSEKPVVETNWKTKQAVQAAGKFVALRLNVEKQIGGTPKMFLEFWHDTLKRIISPRPDYVIEQWEAYDRWLIENHETHRRVAA